jgi:hypothetical protein
MRSRQVHVDVLALRVEAYGVGPLSVVMVSTTRAAVVSMLWRTPGSATATYNRSRRAFKHDVGPTRDRHLRDDAARGRLHGHHRATIAGAVGRVVRPKPAPRSDRDR